MHKTAIRVRFDEVDTMGIVHHPRYLVYFEVARTRYMRDLGLPYSEMIRSGTHLAVLETATRYLRPARYDDLRWQMQDALLRNDSQAAMRSLQEATRLAPGSKAARTYRVEALAGRQ